MKKLLLILLPLMIFVACQKEQMVQQELQSTTFIDYTLPPPTYVSASPGKLGSPHSRDITISWVSPYGHFKITRGIIYSNGSVSNDELIAEVFNTYSIHDNSGAIQAGSIKRVVYAVFAISDEGEYSMGKTVGVSK